MTIQILSSEIKAKVSKNDTLLLKLAQANRVRVDSVKRWIRLNDDQLTTATNLEIIRQELGIEDTVVLTEAKEVEVQS